MKTLSKKQSYQKTGLSTFELPKANPQVQRLRTIPGVGTIIATAFVGKVGDAQAFKNGRQPAAWLGLVPSQYSTGGKVQLGRISKRGDRYLRSLLVHGARSEVELLSPRYQ